MRTSAKEFLDCADDELFAFSNNELNNRPREGPAMTTTATTCGCGAATPRPTATPCSCASRTRAPSPTPQPDQRKTNHRSMAKFNRVLTPCATAHAIATCAPAFCVIASAGNHPRTTWLVPTPPLEGEPAVDDVRAGGAQHEGNRLRQSRRAARTQQQRIGPRIDHRAPAADEHETAQLVDQPQLPALRAFCCRQAPPPHHRHPSRADRTSALGVFPLCRKVCDLGRCGN